MLTILTVTIPQDVIELVPESVIVENRILPFKVEGGRLWLFRSDRVEDPAALSQRIEFMLDRPIEWVVVDDDLLKQALIERMRDWFDGTIDSCPPAFSYRCPKTWLSLAPTADEAIRYCPECKENVYWCTSDDQAWAFGREGKCVAISNVESVDTMGLIDFA